MTSKYLGVEVDRSDVIEMALKSPDAFPSLVVPSFDLVIVSCRHKQRLGLVEINSSDGTCDEMVSQWNIQED